jgi:predicted regulator of Ras-like GTPase activity (Roadblock/LC7/MglB family)
MVIEGGDVETVIMNVGPRTPRVVVLKDSTRLTDALRETATAAARLDL